MPVPVLRRLAGPPDEPALTLEGTVVFVDVSGFTALSERLARAGGREGAEQLADTIGSCFAELLADAYENGASLLKFGGDALLLWFDGDGHPRRACASAVAMRRTLRRIGRVRAGESSIVLRMSVGVHTGDYETFLVGSSHREFLITGPAASKVVAMEGAAGAGQILVSPETAALLPERCLGAPLGPGVLLARAPTLPSWTPPAKPAPAEELVAGCLSTVLRAHLMAAPAAPEHRTAIPAFLQYGGIDRLIAERGPRVAGDALDQLVRIAQAASDRYEICFLGSDIGSDGGKLLFSAGAPRATGGDEERMLLAMRQIVEAGPPVPIRIGINRGNTFTGELGPFYRRTYALMGDTVNLAARFMAKAPWGTIYAAESTLRLSRTAFAITRVPPFMVKGKSRPVEAIEVGPAVHAEPEAGTVKRPPLVGRNRELSSLLEAVSRAQSGDGALIELIGEPGTGKSRLLTEAREAADGMRAIHTTCETYTQAIPYIGWREPLRQLLGLERDDTDEVVLERLTNHVQATDPSLVPWLPLLAIPLGIEAPATREVDDLAPDYRTTKLHEAVLRFIEPALRVPTVVAIEHGHLMDDASAALLGSLAARLAASHWLVLITRRDVDGGFRSGEAAVRLTLGPLTPDEIRALAEAAPEAHAIAPHVLEQAIERSAGSPEFLLDLLAAAADGSGVLPDSVEAATVARIDALEPADRALVRRAAVLGLSFRSRRLRHVLDDGAPEPTEATWRRLSAIFAIDPDGHIRFKRPALCEVAYDGLPYRVRRQLHGALARALERDLGRDPDADPAVLSLHCSRAGDHESSWRYALMGAERATARFANADAARLYRRALDSARASSAPHAELGRLWEALGEALRMAGEPEAALDALRSARTLLRGDPLAEGRLLYHQADITERHAQLTASVRWLLRGLRVLADVDSDEASVLRARITADLGGIRMRQGRVADAITLSSQAIADAEAIGEERALARACYLLDWALVESGRSDEAVHSARALAIYAALGDPEREARVTMNLGTFAYEEGRWDEAVELYRRGAELGMRAGNLDAAANADCNIGEILSDQGRLDEASISLHRALRVFHSIHQRQGAAFVTLLLGRLAVRDRRHVDGLALVEQAAEELAALRMDYYVGLAHACIAEAEAFGGDAGRALELTDRLLAANNRNLALVRRVRAVALIRLGRTSAAVDELEASVTAHGTDYDLAAALDLLDALGVLADGAAKRDEIMARLRIERLPRPPLDPQADAHMCNGSSAQPTGTLATSVMS